MRKAVSLRLLKSKTLEEAAGLAGVSVAGLHKALQQPQNQPILESIKSAYISQVEGRRAVLSANALEYAHDLMLNARSESVRARMVEFLAGRYSEKPTQEVHVKGEVHHAFRGYEYLTPGQALVDVVAVEGDLN